MKILFFSHYFPPEGNAPAVRTHEHCRRWVEAGHQVTVVTCAPNVPNGKVYDGYKNRVTPQIEIVDGIRVVRTWTYLAANSGLGRRTLNYVSYLISAVITSLTLRRPDVIVATSPQFFCGLAGVFASRLRRVPFVLEIRDIWPESIEAVGAVRKRWLLRFLEWLERWMYTSANWIVTVGNGYRDNILSKVDMHDRISVITNGVDVAQFAPLDSGAAIRDKWKLSNKFVCSYVGTVGMAHGLEVMLRAARILKREQRSDICFCVVGDGASREKLESEAARDGLLDVVIFTGRQPRSEIPSILAASDACLIHLKKCELFGTVIPSKIFETMAMKRPIIMGVNGEARQIVLDANAGLGMEPESEQQLITAVQTLADDPELRTRLGQAGGEYVARHYRRDVLAGRYLNLLERIAANGKSAPIQARRAS